MSGGEEPRNIAISTSRSPNSYFNIAKRALESAETAQLSALEGAIVSAVDTAFLLVRAQIASIVSVQTSHAVVVTKTQPKRELKRARIQILLQRTPQYVAFLAANPKSDSPSKEASSPVGN